MTSPLGALFFLAVVAADVYAILNIVQARRENGTKLLWILLVAFLPIVGAAVWFVAGPRGRAS